MGIVFISYRRDDTADTCGRIYDRLERSFGRDRIFKDVDNIPAGVKYARYLDDMVQKCSVQIVVIGPGWLGAANPNGERRLNDPNDFVRIEIEAALKRGIPVIPVLVQGADLPLQRDLPESLRELTDHQALQVRRDPDFNHDSLRLAEALVQWVGPMSSSSSGMGFESGSAGGAGWGQQAQRIGAGPRPQPDPRTAVGVAYAAANAAARTSSLAVGSLVVCILGTGILGWLGIILGHRALREISRSNGALTGRGLAIAGLVIGYIETGFIVVLVLSIIISSIASAH